MATFQALHKYFFIFLALVAFHGSLLTHGRKINIKPLNQHSSLLNTKTTTTTSVPNNPHVVSSKSHNNEASIVLEDSGADNTSAFRPTTPGESPGVGHRIIITSTEDNKMMKSMVVVQSPDAKVSMTMGSKDDFKPTDPGHRPGVGHDNQNKIGQGN